jgi:ATP-dependent DNA helicase RecQ
MLARCETVLKTTFGYDRFRPGQREVLEALAQGRDVLSVMPTGAGKSLCFQLPALALPGLTLVVSPLQALMKDQVQALEKRGVERVAFLNGLMSTEAQSQTLRALARSELRLLYVAPERFASQGFMQALSRNVLSLVAIDEAHCISAWGHDFRPEYRELAPFLAQHPSALRMALTATAPPKVRDDIVKTLQLRDPVRVVLSPDRPNLKFEVESCPAKEKADRLKQLAGQINGSMVVYGGKRADVEELALVLREAGHSALPYHAGLPAEERLRVQEAFLTGEARIICATIAFGMGIDKPDVRAVIHHRHPASLEGYYQEAGRAGRDGKPSRCILLHATRDAALHRFFISNAFPTLEEHRKVYGFLKKGLPPDQMEQADAELTTNKVKVALRTLQTAGYVLRDGHMFRAVVPVERKPLDLSAHDNQRTHALGLLQHMLEYAESRSCLRARLLRYFGEPPKLERCNACSACLGAPYVKPVARRRGPVGPECPDCGSESRKRTSSRGEPFWGCSRYPLCKGTTRIEDSDPIYDD